MSSTRQRHSTRKNCLQWGNLAHFRGAGEQCKLRQARCTPKPAAACKAFIQGRGSSVGKKRPEHGPALLQGAASHAPHPLHLAPADLQLVQVMARLSRTPASSPRPQE